LLHHVFEVVALCA